MAQTRVAALLLLLWVGSGRCAENGPFMVTENLNTLQERSEEHEDYDPTLETAKKISLMLRSRENNSLAAPEFNLPKSSSEERSSFLVVPMVNVTWLSDGVAGNVSHVFVSLAGHLNAFLVEEPMGDLNFDSSCTNPPEPPLHDGRCLPLVRCALQEVVEEFATFLPHFCAIGRHAGVCCPRLVVRSLQWAQAAKTRAAANYRSLSPIEDLS